jgi:uncharacterized membrane protein
LIPGIFSVVVSTVIETPLEFLFSSFSVMKIAVVVVVVVEGLLVICNENK